MSKITWKRKASNITTSTAAVFSKQTDSEGEESDQIVEDWRTLLPSKKNKTMLEDRVGKSKRLIQEAVQLAENER